MAEEFGQDVNMNYLATVVDRLAWDVQGFEADGLRSAGPAEPVRNRRLASLLWLLAFALCVPIAVVIVADRATAVPPLDGAIRLMAALLVVTALTWGAVTQLLVRRARWDFPRDAWLEVHPAFVDSLTDQIMKAARAGVTPPHQ